MLVLYAAPPLLYPDLRDAPPENALLFVLGVALTLGLLITGVVTFRAGALPRSAGLLILGATCGFFFEFFVAELLPPTAGRAGAAVLAMLVAAGFARAGLTLMAARASA